MGAAARGRRRLCRAVYDGFFLTSACSNQSVTVGGGANGPLQGALRAWRKVNSHLHQNFHSLPEQRAHPTHPLKPPKRGAPVSGSTEQSRRPENNGSAEVQSMVE